MKVFGHPWVESEPFYLVTSIEAISKTPPNSLLELNSLSSSLALAKYCQQNSLQYALNVETISDAIFANILGAKFILCSSSLAQELMPIAQNYLFDTEILVLISNVKELENMAKLGVDAVLFSNKS